MIQILYKYPPLLLLCMLCHCLDPVLHKGKHIIHFFVHCSKRVHCYPHKYRKHDGLYCIHLWYIQIFDRIQCIICRYRSYLWIRGQSFFVWFTDKFGRNVGRRWHRFHRFGDELSYRSEKGQPSHTLHYVGCLRFQKDILHYRRSMVYVIWFNPVGGRIVYP